MPLIADNEITSGLVGNPTCHGHTRRGDWVFYCVPDLVEGHASSQKHPKMIEQFLAKFQIFE